MTLKDFNETFSLELQDPEFASIYLDDALASGDPRVFLAAIDNVVRANCTSAASIGRHPGLGKASMKSLAGADDASFAAVEQVLRSVGLRLHVAPDQVHKADRTTTVPA